MKRGWNPDAARETNQSNEKAPQMKQSTLALFSVTSCLFGMPALGQEPAPADKLCSQLGESFFQGQEKVTYRFSSLESNIFKPDAITSSSRAFRNLRCAARTVSYEMVETELSSSGEVSSRSVFLTSYKVDDAGGIQENVFFSDDFGLKPSYLLSSNRKVVFIDRGLDYGDFGNPDKDCEDKYLPQGKSSTDLSACRHISDRTLISVQENGDLVYDVRVKNIAVFKDGSESPVDKFSVATYLKVD